MTKFEPSDKQLITDVLDIARQLPTGLKDDKSLEKFALEMKELAEALRSEDRLSVVLEAADCLYYILKAEANNLITPQELAENFKLFSVISALDIDILLKAVVAKYTQRIRGGKDDQKEKVAVAAMLSEN